MISKSFKLVSLGLLLLKAPSAFSAEVQLNSDNLTSVYRKYSKQAVPERLVMQARKKEEGHFFRSFLPSLDASYAKEGFREEGFPTATSTGWNVQGRMSLFNGGRDWLEEKVRESRTSAAYALWRVKEQSVLEQIRKSFWSTIYVQALISTIEKAQKDNDDISKLAEKRIRSGVASNVDRLDFRMNGIRLKQDLQRAKNELRNTENNLRALLMIPMNEKIVITQKMTDDHDILEVMGKRKAEVSNNPTFAAIQAQSEVESNSAAINSRWFLPKLDLYAGYERPTLREDDTGGFGLSQWYAGLALSFSLGEVATSIRTQQARSLEADAQMQLKQNTLSLNEASIEALTENIKSLHDLFHDAETSVKEAEDYVSRILREYDKGVKNSIDALNATRQSYDARREGLTILRDYKFAIVDFYNLIGDQSGLPIE